ncbi:efflux transporter outer membrane subunit (plasmid) [Cupriavidus sp. KK10]|jgi:multidrug efflux system outer membrane protein|uniref:efflux transporter outer membrane subunit n=1 Tax=Cupriavidus sp. KK10 TaxID=1478019 RepID=UPI001BA951A0|nr:efflux transporter outer membrane subunit [Cupriavidus sp. KK10]QUN32519.1 efflux transporter outer membrane subunit [Cupriavidus sp. KK10]
MRKLSLATIVVALWITGCTMAPHYRRPDAPVSASFPNGGVYQTQSPEASGKRSANGQAAPDIGWRDFFVDRSLQQLIGIALRNNRDLRVAVLNIEAARAQYQITRAGLLPAVGAAASQSKQRTPPDLSRMSQTVSDVYSVGLNASWEIDLFGRIRSLKDQALSQYLATAQARKAAELSLVSQVADQYLTMLAYDELIAVTQDTLNTAQGSYRLTQLKFDNGTGSELDLRQAQTVVDQAQASLQAQARARAQAENLLVLLIGEPLPSDLAPGAGLDSQDLLEDIPAGLPSDLLSRRPDIMEAEENLLAANANIGAARAAFFPKVTLTGTFGTLSPSLGGLFKPGSAAWAFGPQISIPIFEGGTNLANLDLAEVRKEIQVAQYERAIQAAFREVADGLAARGTYDQEIEARQRDTLAEQRRLELSQLRYRSGVDSYLSVLTAQNDLYASRQSLITTRVQRLTSLVGLYRTLGGGWIERSGEAPRPADAPGAG